MEPNQIPPIEVKALTSAERKQKSREKQRAIASGIYERSLFEQAKECLCSMEPPDLSLLLSDLKFKNVFNPEEISTLRNFIYYLKQKRKKEHLQQEQKDQQKQYLVEKTLRFGNDQTQELRILFSGSLSEKELEPLIEEKIQSNLFSFLDYLETLQSTDQLFLKVILGLQPKMAPSAFTKLFIRVCSLYKGEDLVVSSHVIEQAISYLNENPKDTRAATGLLRLAFKNDISFTMFSKEILIHFNEINEHVILQFFRTLTGLKPQIIESLPGTTFFFTTPLIQTIKDGGKALLLNLPVQFLPHIIEIVCYSFTEQNDVFHRFIDTFREGCLLFFEKLFACNFVIMLHSILDEIKAMNPKFFQNLDRSTLMIKRAFKLLQEKKIAIFTDEIVEQILNSDEEQFHAMAERPRVLRSSSKETYRRVFSSFAKDFVEFQDHQQLIETELTPIQRKLIMAVGIQELTPLQHVVLKLMSEGINRGRWLLQYPTGQGKTALCFCLAALKAIEGRIAIIVNESEDLTFRDFKKASSSIQETDLNVLYCNSDMDIKFDTPGVVYMTMQRFITLSESLHETILANISLIIDEFDSILGQHNDIIALSCKATSKIQSVIGFSGSNFQGFHKQFIESTFQMILVKVDPHNSLKMEIECLKVQVLPSLVDFRKSIQLECKERTCKSPIIIIADEQVGRIQQCLQAIKIPYETLSSMKPAEVDSVMNLFTHKQDERYPVYLISGQQGRGIDFPSDSHIEAEGGVYLIIAALPSNFLQYQQFLGRTGRLGNKGQYSIILFDRESKNTTGSSYMQKHLTILMNEDLVSLSKLSTVLADKSRSQDSDHEDQHLSQQTKEIIPENNRMDKNEQKELETSNLQKRAFTEVAPNVEEAKVQLREETEPISQLDQNLEFIERCTNKRDTKANVKECNLNRKQKREQEMLITQTDLSYFEGYSRKDIHIEMLSDEVRMTCYREALKLVANDKIVLDVGSGTGALCLMAAEAGAIQVIGIENSDIIASAKKQIKFLRLDKKIIFIKGRAENIKPQFGKVDIIVSEWMGYFLLMEGMLGSVLAARDQWLKEGGVIVPQKTCIHLAGISSQQDSNSLLQAIMDPMLYRNAQVDICKSNNVITTEATVFDFDLKTDKLQYNGFQSNFEITATRTDLMTGLVGWFTADMVDGLTLSTSPHSPPTHWKQTIFTFEKFLNVIEGDIIECQINVAPLSHNHRGLEIILFYSKKTQGFENKISYWLE